MNRSLVLFISFLLLSAFVSAEEKAEELWFGKVVFAQYRNTINKNGEPEITIEWLARRYNLITPLTLDEIAASKKPIQVKDAGEQYFVSTLRIQEMKKETVINLVDEANKLNPISVQIGKAQFKGIINNVSATYIDGSGGGGIYPKLKLELH